MILLRRIILNIGDTNNEEYPLNIPFIKKGFELELTKAVTFFIWENGTGKSTLLESIAQKCWFNPLWGNRNHTYTVSDSKGMIENILSEHITLWWNPPKTTNWFFMRAESFFNFSNYVDDIAKYDSRILSSYWGKSLHHQSHWESFLSLFSNKFKEGLFILDEPESALSPDRLLAFMRIIHDLEKSGKVQFLIATHSPILLSYPNATILTLDEECVRNINYKDTTNYQTTKFFLDSPDIYLNHIFNDD